VQVAAREAERDGEPGIEITVRDDGTGISESTPRGRGLGNMQRRTDILGGRLTVRGGPDGTIVRVWLPSAARRNGGASTGA